jgi:hypothetical protein
MPKTLIQQIEEVLDRKLDEKLDEKLGVFVKHVDDRFDGLAEAMMLMNERLMTLPTRDEFNEVKADIATIKIAVRDTNSELHGL